MAELNLNKIVKSEGVDLSGCLVIACQHVLQTNTVLFNALLDSGLKKQNLFIIGKAYSTIQEARRSFIKRGIYVDPGSVAFDSHKSFDRQFAQYVQRFLKKIRRKIDPSTFRKIILIDDGGQLLLTAEKLFKDKSNLVGVEQTSSGYEKIKGRLSYPVVNVARSKAKLVKESPFIAEEVIRVLSRSIGRAKLHVLVVGQGPVGLNIAKLLSRNYKVSKYDLSLHNHPFPGKFTDVLHSFDLIIGCTGTTILTPRQLSKLKKGVVLVSASSSDREFPSAYLRSKLPKNNNPHKLIKADGFKLLNSGFPINFTGAPGLPLDKIILTRALMFLGVVQASKFSGQQDIIGLEDKYQRLAIKLYQKK